jgi:tetraacyldisaccharide 4'-kinase
MNPLSVIFSAVVAARNAVYDRGLAAQQTLHHPVVSIGNLNVGGSGKTPFAIALGGLFAARGIAFDVLSRGYGRESTGAHAVTAESDPREVGDEPVLIASRLEAPVVVAAERIIAGRLAETLYPARLHLLDDGFQHRQLARQFDIVMLSARDLEGTLLPVGRLREPLSSLRRADAIVLADDVPSESLDAKLPGLAARIWRVRRTLLLPEPRPFHPVVFCGIAQPEPFFAQLRALGVNAAKEITFRDHYAYAVADLHKLAHTASEFGADGFITTEKDEVKLRYLSRSGAAELANLHVARLSTELVDSDATLAFLLATLDERSPGWRA